MIGGSIARKLLKRMGREVIAYDYRTHPVARRMHLLQAYGVSLVLDVGANVGQFGSQLRALGYTGRIVSFEPLKDAYRQLERLTYSDPLWTTFNCAIGSHESVSEINVAGNGESSSMLRMLPMHLKSAPESSYREREEIRIRTLDSMLPTINAESEVIYLKSDTQGYESEVLKGAAETLTRAVGVQLELSLIPLYEGETLFADMIQEMSAQGLQLMSLEHVFSDPATGQLLQVDAIFFRDRVAHDRD